MVYNFTKAVNFSYARLLLLSFISATSSTAIAPHLFLSLAVKCKVPWHAGFSPLWYRLSRSGLKQSSSGLLLHRYTHLRPEPRCQGLAILSWRAYHAKHAFTEYVSATAVRHSSCFAIVIFIHSVWMGLNWPALSPRTTGFCKKCFGFFFSYKQTFTLVSICSLVLFFFPTKRTLIIS